MKTTTINNQATTHIGKMRGKNAAQMLEVCKLLRWTPERYCQHQFEQYELFATTMTAPYPEMKTWIRYSAVFRGFWNNEWLLRNQHNFLPFAYDCKYDYMNMIEEYMHINNAITLIHDEAFYSRFENLLKLI